jgi:6-phosphogluconolactonase (cycloisomerase 2 family)
MALGVAGILSLSMGTASCVHDPACQCALSAAASKFAYVTGNGSISAFSLNASTGVLTPVNGSPFSASDTGDLAAADPAGKFLFLVVPGLGIYAYTIDQNTGALTQVSGSPFKTTSIDSAELRQPVVDPSGSFLYVAVLDSCGDGCAGAISAFKINTDGSLTEIAGSPFKTDYGAIGIAVHPSGHFVYSINSSNCCKTTDTVSVFQVNATSGALTEVAGSPFALPGAVTSGFFAEFGAVHPNGQFLYVTALTNNNTTNGSVYGFSIDTTSGALTSLSGSPFAAGLNPLGIDVDSIDNFLFVVNAGPIGGSRPPGVDGNIMVYKIDASTGNLTPVQGSPFGATTETLFLLAVDESCRYVYVTDPSGLLFGFSINSATGALTPVPGSPLTVSGSIGVVLTPHRSVP